SPGTARHLQGALPEGEFAMPSPWWNLVRSPSSPPRRRCRPAVEPLEDRRVLTALVALSTKNQLLAFDSSAPGTIQGTLPVTGLQASEALLDIDFRPSTGQLYALGSSNRIYTVNTTSGVATPVGSGTFAVPLSGAAFGFNFDPVADQIRVISDTGQNLRLNPD